MSAHTCHARGCDVRVPPRMFMCRKHWFSLPKAMRDAIWATYTPGQERHLDRVTPAYLDVARAARDWLANKDAPAAVLPEETNP